MGNFDLKQLLTSKPTAKVLEEAKQYVIKWEPTGLLDGLETETDKRSVALLLENQAKQLIAENTRTGTAADSEAWSGVALPLVRRIFGEIAAKEFLSVQPMNMPSGLVFYLDFKYGTSVNGRTSGQSLFGGSGAANRYGITDVATGGLYGAGKFGYTINDQLSSLMYGTASSAATLGGAYVTQATYADVNFDTTLSQSISLSNLFKFSINSASIASNLDREGVRAFFLTSSTQPTYQLATLNAFSTYDFANERFIMIVSGTTLQQVASASFGVGYHVQPTVTGRGDFEDTGAGKGSPDIGIPEINLDMKQVSIIAKTRKLQAIWTPELAQDLNAYHSVDAEAELTGMLSEYISMEIDLELLDMLIQDAITTDYWTTKIGYEWDSTQQGFVLTNPSPLAYQKSTWFQTLGVKIQKVSNKIHQLTMRGGANFLVCSPDVATILESVPGYTVDSTGDQQKFAMGVTKVGSYANRFDVYKNPYMIENIILMGFKGSNFFETGAVYAPYIPLIITPLIYDPTNYTPRKAVMTRYAKKMVRPEFYGRVIIAGLEQL
jgi:hypothetical protein